MKITKLFNASDALIKKNEKLIPLQIAGNNHIRYSVDSTGNVFTHKIYIKKGYSKKRMKPYVNNKGYLALHFVTGDSRKSSMLVHRIVCIVFAPNPEFKPHVNHINSKRDDNRLENLEWCTMSENMIHCLWESPNRDKNISTVRATICKAIEKIQKPVIHIDSGKEYKSIREGARDMGISNSGIIYHVKGLAKHPKWKYAT